MALPWGPVDPTTDEPKLRPFLSVWCAAVTSLGAQAQDRPIPDDGPTVRTTPSGLEYSVLKSTEGEVRPKPGDLVSFHYTGWLEDGRLFDTSRGGSVPFEMVLGVGMIKAWTESMTQMTPGSQLKLDVPPELAFGAAGAELMEIPPDARVIYEIELFSIGDGIDLPVFSLPDSTVQKTTASGLKYEVLRAGQGRPLKPGERFEVEYTLFNQRGELIDTSHLLWKQPMVGRLGEEIDGPAFLGEAVAMLQRDGNTRFEVPAKLGFAEGPLHPLVPANTKTFWELELVRVAPAAVPRDVPEFAILDPLTAKRTASGLRYEIVEPGAGKTPGPEDTVTVHYAGWLSTGRLFDDSMTAGLPRKIPLIQTIPGWREGLQLMSPGAIYRFAVPAKLAYGLSGVQALGIGPNRLLHYYVELIEVDRIRR